MAGRVIVLAGCSGSGKSSYARQQFPEGLVVSSDQYFEELAARHDTSYRDVWDLRLQGSAHARCRARFEAAIAAGTALVIVDNTSPRASDRNRFVKRALEHGYDVEVHVLGPAAQGAAPLSPEAAADYVALCHRRNVHGVPLEVIARQFDQLDLPAGVYGVGQPPPFLRALDPWADRELR